MDCNMTKQKKLQKKSDSFYNKGVPKLTRFMDMDTIQDVLTLMKLKLRDDNQFSDNFSLYISLLFFGVSQGYVDFDSFFSVKKLRKCSLMK